MAGERTERDLVLAPTQFIHIQDRTKGRIGTMVGPAKASLSDTEQGVVLDPSTGKWRSVTNINEAVRENIFAPEGSYVVLSNPVKGPTTGPNVHPTVGASDTPELDMGRTINIPGPVIFALWPGQIARTIKGHTLRSNQYLVCEVYNAQAAMNNWDQMISDPQRAPISTDNKAESPDGKPSKAPEAPHALSDIDPQHLVTGQKLIIKGTEVSFFIPPTGIAVASDSEGGEDEDHCVRRAVTLQTLEYCICQNEQGKTRYPRGADVVFPQPDEDFVRHVASDGRKTRRYQAYSLTALQGLHLQVISDFTDDEGKQHKAGEEIFLTGKDHPIFFPRPELAIIKYDGQEEIHNSIVIPAGEGRYVLDRASGEVPVISGPQNFLPNPINQTLVRRVLSESECGLIVPGNTAALLYNKTLAAANTTAPAASASTPSNFVSESALRSSRGGNDIKYMSAMLDASSAEYLGRSAAPSKMANEIERGNSFKPPRTIILDTRFEGAVSIRPYVGYAAKIISKTGKSRIVTHPQTALLAYDETLQRMTFSKGTPKSDTDVEFSGYLKVSNNKVSDAFKVETSDMVVVSVGLSMRVNFEGDPQTWFAVDNYVKLLCDHVRSKVAACVKNHTIQDFYAHSATIIRDIILGEQDDKNKRPGMAFAENGMRVYEVEVTAIQITNSKIANMLIGAAEDAFSANLQMASMKRQLSVAQATAETNTQIANSASAYERRKMEIQKEEALEAAKTVLARLQNDLNAEQMKLTIDKANQSREDAIHTSKLARTKAMDAQDTLLAIERQKLAIDLLTAEAVAMRDKFATFSGPLAEALLALGTQDTMKQMAHAGSLLTQLGGPDIATILGKVMDTAGFKVAYESVVSQRPLGGTMMKAITDAATTGVASGASRVGHKD